jgi:CheY-like chemotaxis protein
MPYLFERFFRGTAGRESGTTGIGLGLAILKEIVERHFEGRVEVSSAGIPGEGATFTVWLPLAGQHAANLLIVDDNATLLGVMQEILSAFDYDVQAISSGQAALEALLTYSDEDRVPDLVVADVVMPGMTGLQLLDAVRENDNWAGIPFLFVSGSTTLAMEGQIAGLENVHFLRKPFDTETLKETVAAALSPAPMSDGDG